MEAALASSAQTAYKKNQLSQDVGHQSVVGAIQKASARTGVDFAYLLGKADQESGLNPSAKATTSSATGLYQFVKQTWLQMVKEHGAAYGLGEEAGAIDIKNGKATVKDPELREKILNLRHDPVLSAAMAAEFTKDNKDHLDASVGGNIGSTELYLAHFLGAGGASTFLKNMRAAPNMPAADIMPDAAAANPSVFYSKSGRELSLQEVYNRFAAKFSEKGLSKFADITKGASALPSIEDVNCTVPDTSLKRDLAAFSSSFYVPPTEEASLWRNNSTTSDTLFNVMIMAQSSMNESLSSFVRNAKDDTKRL